MVDFAGLPYIDVRVSFNSFIPADIGPELANKLANYYIDCLISTPSNHDKIEFEVIYSCYTLDLEKRLEPLLKNGFSVQDCETLSNSLKGLTNRIIHGVSGLWRTDIAKIEELEQRFSTIDYSSLDTTAKIYWLVEDCKRYGTLPFAGLARAGFIAVQLLKSLVSAQVFSEDDLESYMASLNTVSSRISEDFKALSREDFLSKYGHLRPGTYDILSDRYDENPDIYFNWSRESSDEKKGSSSKLFTLTDDQKDKLEVLLDEHGIEHSADSLLDFITASIEGREYAKFVFSRHLSRILCLMTDLAEDHGFTRKEIAFAEIAIIKDLHSSTTDPSQLISDSIARGKEKYNTTSQITLPPLIVNAKDIYEFELPRGKPNFVTLKNVTANIVSEFDDLNELQGKIVMLPSADPGYDWIFSHDIGGLITMYGGANSHMAIRAAELGIPSVIGAGEVFFQQWLDSHTLEIDCSNKQVKIIR